MDNENEYIWSFGDELESELKAEKKKKRRALAVYATIVTLLFLAAAAALTVLIIQTDIAANSPTVIEKTIYVKENNSESGILTIQEIASEVTPSTVGIKAEKALSTSIGTGIVYSEDGYIITNCHVISGAEKIIVIMNDKTEFEAELIGSDDVSDVAVVKIVPGDYKLKPAAFGDSDTLMAGDDVVAIGNPAGLEYAGTITTGIVSSISREVNIYSSNGLLEKKMTLIQNSAAINPGNSGGPLIDLYGKVVGINTMRFSSGEYVGIGFAIPINGALPVIEEIIETGSYSGNNPVAVKGVSLGITGRDVEKGETVQISETETFTPGMTGVLVVEIIDENSSAYGVLKEYDVIISIAGDDTPHILEIREMLLSHKQGDTIDLQVYRDGKIVNLKLTFK